MNKVLRCIILSSLFVMSMVASVLAAPYDPPVAIATPPIDRALLAAYGEAAHGADIRFTIREDGSVGMLKLFHLVALVLLMQPLLILFLNGDLVLLQIPMVSL